MAEASCLVSSRTKVRAPSGGNPSSISINSCARAKAAPLHGLIGMSDGNIKHGSLLRAMLKLTPNSHHQTCRDAGAKRFVKVVKGAHVLKLVVKKKSPEGARGHVPCPQSSSQGVGPV